MWFSGFPHLVFMAAILCTLAAAERDRVVRYASTLKLEFSELDNGWKQVQGPGDFFAKVYISEDDKYIAVSQMNSGHILDSYEALLSIWERESGLGAGQLRRIKYYNVNKESDVSIFDDIFTAFDYNPRRYNKIPGISIERDNNLYAYQWNSLRTTTFGSDAIDICTVFEETDGLYIESFDIGREGSNGRWIRVNFEMNDED